MQLQEARKILLVQDNATKNEIKDSYRKLVLELHPDKNNTKTEESFKKVTVAYNLLKNAPKDEAEIITPRKKQYDWGASKGAPPEEDWSKYTREFEEGDPTFWREYEKNFWKNYDLHKKRDRNFKEEEKAREPDQQPDLKIYVDQSLCIGCTSCETIASSVFSVDTSKHNGKSHVVDPKGAKFNKIMDAAETCPTKAIIVDSENRRLWPL